MTIRSDVAVYVCHVSVYVCHVSVKVCHMAMNACHVSEKHVMCPFDLDQSNIKRVYMFLIF